jgi:hypothetical protein
MATRVRRPETKMVILAALAWVAHRQVDLSKAAVDREI